MQRKRFISAVVTIVALLALMLAVAGCGASPGDSYASEGDPCAAIQLFPGAIDFMPAPVHDIPVHEIPRPC